MVNLSKINKWNSEIDKFKNEIRQKKNLKSAEKLLIKQKTKKVARMFLQPLRKLFFLIYKVSSIFITLS